MLGGVVLCVVCGRVEVVGGDRRVVVLVCCGMMCVFLREGKVVGGDWCDVVLVC